MSEEGFLLGAVGTDAHRMKTWDEWRDRARTHGFAFDYVIYSNYDRLVDDLMHGLVNAAVLTAIPRERASRMAADDELDLLAVREFDDAVLVVHPVSADEAVTTRFVQMVGDEGGHRVENANPPAKNVDENSSARVARPSRAS
jgi:hypothetical protein